ncbi:hypothetical protein WDU94_002262 [Cyamophila willieti]
MDISTSSTNLTSTFDFIEIEFFERRLYELVKSTSRKQNEISQSESKVKQLKVATKQKLLTNEAQKLQWRGIIRMFHTLRDFNYKLIVDTERIQLKDRIKSLKNSIPGLQDENQSLLTKNLTLGYSKETLNKEIEGMKAKLTATKDIETEKKIRQIEVYHRTLVQNITGMKQQMKSLRNLITKIRSRRISQDKTMGKIRIHTIQLEHSRDNLNQELTTLQISNLDINPNEDIPQKLSTEKTVLEKNRASVMQDLRACVDKERRMREQLNQHKKELELIENEDLNKRVKVRGNGEFEYVENDAELESADQLRDAAVIGAEGIGRYFNTQDDQFVLEHFLSFDED